MRFYSQFKPFGRTGFNVFPTIYFNTALGNYPVLRMKVILVVPELPERLGTVLPELGGFGSNKVHQLLGLFRLATTPGTCPKPLTG